TCKWGSADVAYASLPNTFTTTGGTSHTTTLTGLTNGTSYSRYVRCQDLAGNVNATSTTISFSVASSAPGPVGTVSDLQVSSTSTTSATLRYTEVNDGTG